MTRWRRWRLAAAGLSLLATTGAPCAHASEPASAPVLRRVAAGFGGVVHAGRWTPVRVEIENSGPDFAGELIVESGRYRTVQAIALPSPSHKELELYVRADGAEAKDVRVSFGGSADSRAIVPVRAVDSYSDFTLCIAPADGDPGSGCDGAITADEAPRGWRGYDGADAVRVSGSLPDAQRDGLARWRRRQDLRAWIAPAMPRRDPPDAASSRHLLLLAYVIAIVGVWLGSRRLARTPFGPYLAIAIVAVVSGGAVAAHGRVGPGASVLIADTAIVRAAAGVPGAFIDARGTIAFPAHGAYVVQPRASDALFDSGESPLRLDEDGRSTIAGRFAREQQLEFALDGFADMKTLAVVRDGGTWRITNESPLVLRDCRLPEGLAPREIARIDPGAVVTMSGDINGEDRAMTCLASGDIPTVAVHGRMLEQTTAGALVFDLGARQP